MTWPTVSTSAGSKRIPSPPPCTASPGTTIWSRTRARRASRPGGPRSSGSVGEADAIAAGPLTPADAVTLDCTTEAATQELAIIDMARAEHTVTAMPYCGAGDLPGGGRPDGPGRPGGGRGLPDPAAAQRRAGSTRSANGCGPEPGRGGSRWLRSSSRPSAGPRASWPRPVPGAGALPRPPQGWDGGAAWEAERRAVAEEVVKPALARWVATIKELLPRARPSAQAGLVLPAGRRGGLRPGGPDLHDPAAVAGRTAPDRPGSHRRAGGPGRGARRRAWGFPGWTRYSPRCGTRPGRSRRPRPSARRRSR